MGFCPFKYLISLLMSYEHFHSHSIIIYLFILLFSFLIMHHQSWGRLILTSNEDFLYLFLELLENQENFLFIFYYLQIFD
jgi:hypothetical protein